VTVKLLQSEPLRVAHVNSHVVPHPLSLATVAARQQRRCGAKMINNWQVPGGESMDTREIMRIVASNTARIDLLMGLRLDPYE